MSNSHATQLDYLLIAIALLVMAIFVPIVLSLLKKKPKSELKNESETQLQGESQVESLAKSQLNEKTNLEPKNDFSAKEPISEDEFTSTATIERALKKTNESFFGRIKSAFSNQDKKKVIEEIEEVLYTSDLGPKTVQKLLSQVEQELSSSDMANLDKVKNALAKQMQDILIQIHESQKNSKLVSELLPQKQNEPIVLMVVGVNGAGKTTSIGKMTAQLAHQGFKVLVAAGDTFRAAAGGQLKVWTDRAASAKGYVEIFWPDNVTDPAAVAFDAVSKAKAQNYDYVILDTAGRLHTQAHLMDELKKVKRVMSKVIADAPHETWIVLDANSGQNALNQAQEFNKALEVTGVILTKMDGTAKGGVALGVVDQLAKPIRLVGLGEKIGDLKVFEPQEYIESILG